MGMELIYLFVAMISCIIGALGGIGGGIIIKPAIDLMGQYSLLNIGLLASSTVLAMTIVSVWKMRRHIMGVGFKLVFLIAIGSLLGGVFGGYLFGLVSAYYKIDKYIGIIQTIVLLTVILAVILIELNKKRLVQKSYRSPFIIIMIGVVLGTISSFLGIGGGPFNKPTIYLLLGLSSKASTVGSLCIVFFSQASNIVRTLALHGTAPFDFSVLPYMIVGAILGGYIGGWIINKVDEVFYDKLFMGVLVIILFINFANLYQYILS